MLPTLIRQATSASSSECGEEVRARVNQALEKRRLLIENRGYQDRLEERVAAQARRDLLDDAQSQPGSGNTAGAPARLPERLEHERDELRLDAGAAPETFSDVVIPAVGMWGRSHGQRVQVLIGAQGLDEFELKPRRQPREERPERGRERAEHETVHLEPDPAAPRYLVNIICPIPQSTCLIFRAWAGYSFLIETMARL